MVARAAAAATFASGVLWLGAVLAGSGTGGLGRWSAGATFGGAGLTVLAGLGRRLPLQNLGAVLAVAWASALLGLTLAVKSGFLLGGVVYSPDFGPRILGIVPWQLPLIWLALVLTSRETARLLLRPWRRHRAYGYLLFGLSAVLVVWTELALEPFAVRVARWWEFDRAATSGGWAGVPWMVFPTGAVLALFMLGFVGPWLIVKRAIPTPPDFVPLGVWLALNAVLLFGNIRHGSWLPSLATLSGAGFVTLGAWRHRASLPAVSDGVPRREEGCAESDVDRGSGVPVAPRPRR